ncbi:MAG TPA: hypothetical protein VGK32_11745 [Vicinamibacterales bacterium]|jgi:hypothetical protein
MATIRSWREAADDLLRDLRTILDTRLRALVVYEAHGLLGDMPVASPGDEAGLRHEQLVHSVAIVDGLGHADLLRLAPLAAGWAGRSLAVPLFLSPTELQRSLDAFPLEFGQILARHVVIVGDDPFRGLAVASEDMRRACEAQVRSHLLHLREGYLQTAAEPKRVAALVAASVVPLRALLVNIARLHGVEARTPKILAEFVEQRLRLPMGGLRPLLSAKQAKLFEGEDVGAFLPAYLDAVERLAALVDEWSRT